MILCQEYAILSMCVVNSMGAKPMKFIFNDGGRSAAGYKGFAGDCVARSIAIASGKPYQEIYDRLAKGQSTQRRSKRTSKQPKSARNGIYVKRKWFKDYMAELGFEWVPTMKIGSGCTTHLTDGELPGGRLVVAVSKHLTAVIDGVVYDTHDPQREAHCVRPNDGAALKAGEWINPGNNLICKISRRCVYGYWIYRGETE